MAGEIGRGIGRGLAGLGGLALAGLMPQGGRQEGFAQGFQQTTGDLRDIAAKAEASRQARMDKRLAMLQQITLQNPQAFVTGAPGALSPQAQQPFLEAVAEPIAEQSNQPGTKPGTASFNVAQELVQNLGTRALQGKGLSPADALRGFDLATAKGDHELGDKFLAFIAPDLVFTPEEQAAISPEDAGKWAMAQEFFTPESRVAMTRKAMTQSEVDLDLLEFREVPGQEKSTEEQLRGEYWHRLKNGLVDDSLEDQVRSLAFMRMLDIGDSGVTRAQALNVFSQAVSGLAGLAVLSDDPAFMDKSISMYEEQLRDSGSFFQAVGVNPSSGLARDVAVERLQFGLMGLTPLGRKKRIEDLAADMREKMFKLSGAKEPVKGSTIEANDRELWNRMLKDEAVKLGWDKN